MPGCQWQQCCVTAVTWLQDERIINNAGLQETLLQFPALPHTAGDAATFSWGSVLCQHPVAGRGGWALCYTKTRVSCGHPLICGGGVSCKWEFGQHLFIRPNVTEQITSIVNVRVDRNSFFFFFRGGGLVKILAKIWFLYLRCHLHRPGSTLSIA